MCQHLYVATPKNDRKKPSPELCPYVALFFLSFDFPPIPPAACLVFVDVACLAFRDNMFSDGSGRIFVPAQWAEGKIYIHGRKRHGDRHMYA